MCDSAVVHLVIFCIIVMRRTTVIDRRVIVIALYDYIWFSIAVYTVPVVDIMISVDSSVVMVRLKISSYIETVIVGVLSIIFKKYVIKKIACIIIISIEVPLFIIIRVPIIIKITIAFVITMMITFKCSL
jgi:hypothetical protein